MRPIEAKTRETPLARSLRAWDRYRNRLILLTGLLSLLIHLSSYLTLGDYAAKNRLNVRPPVRQPIKVKIVNQPKPKKSDDALTPEQLKILEAQQTPTAPPKKPTHLGQVDHQAVKEMRTPPKLSMDRAKDPGAAGVQKPATIAPKPKSETKKPNPQETAEKSPQNSEKKPTPQSPFGTLSMAKPEKRKARTSYEALLPSSLSDLPNQLNAGYQDHLDEDIPIGDRIDINTSEYRYIGYFTAMRKAIELVWNYPIDAVRKGMQGEVALEFAIAKDGRASHVRVLKSSGYEILDRAIVEAIKLASPFPPLPDGFKKNKLVITGSFRYILGPYAAH